MTVMTSAGSIIAISAAQPATFDTTGYAALTYTNVGEVSDLGEFGRVYNVVKYNTIQTRATTKRKGSYDEGTMSLKIGYDDDDAGQLLLQTASASDADYSFKLTLQDGSVFYFQAQVSTFKITVGSVDSITEVMVSLELTSGASGVGVVQVLA